MRLTSGYSAIRHSNSGTRWRIHYLGESANHLIGISLNLLFE